MEKVCSETMFPAWLLYHALPGLLMILFPYSSIVYTSHFIFGGHCIHLSVHLLVIFVYSSDRHVMIERNKVW